MIERVKALEARWREAWEEEQARRGALWVEVSAVLIGAARAYHEAGEMSRRVDLYHGSERVEKAWHALADERGWHDVVEPLAWADGLERPGEAGGVWLEGIAFERPEERLTWERLERIAAVAEEMRDYANLPMAERRAVLDGAERAARERQEVEKAVERERLLERERADVIAKAKALGLEVSGG